MLKKESVYFGTQFEGIVHRSEQGMTAEGCVWSFCVYSKETKGKAGGQLHLIFDRFHLALI